jgi:hypothetical protein
MGSLAGMEGLAEFDFEDENWMDTTETSDYDSMAIINTSPDVVVLR